MDQLNQLSSSNRQRIVRSEEQILQLLEEYEGSGFTLKDFCEVSDINEATFYSWMKRFRPKPSSEEVKGFASIELVPSVGTSNTLFAKIGKLEIHKEVSAEFLKSLIL